MLFIATIVVSLVNKYDYQNNACIFNTIEDLDFLNDDIVEDDIKDTKLGNLSCASNKSVQVKYDGRNYRLFAYEFNSIEDVFSYGKAVTGNDYQNICERFENNSWCYSEYYAITVIPISSRMFVFQEANVLYVESKGISQKQFNKFIDYLFTNLPQKVDLVI